MSKQSSENYLDQLLSSMNTKSNRSKDKQVQALEKEIESVKQTLRTRDENSFYDELESELDNDEYKRFVSDFESELDEDETTPKKEQKKKSERVKQAKKERKTVEKKVQREEEPVQRLSEAELDKMLPEEPKAFEEPVAQEVPIQESAVQDLSNLSEAEIDKLLSEEANVFEEVLPQEVPIQESAVQDISNLSEAEIDKLLSEEANVFEEVLPQEPQETKPQESSIFDQLSSREPEALKPEELEGFSLEDLVMEEIKPEDIPVEEPVVQDLSNLSEEELDKLLSEGADFEDIEKLLSGETNLAGEEGATDFEKFAQEEMPGVIEIGEGADLDSLIPELPKKKETFFDKLKKLLFGEDDEEDMVVIGEKGVDASSLAKENKKILEAFEESEGNTKGKKKKEKKKKEKKEKPKKEKKEKKPKPPKPKKEKKEKKPKEVDKTPPLPKKPVILIWLFALSILALIVLGTNFSSYFMSVKTAKNFLKEGDYSSGIVEMEGLTVKEKDLELYNQLVTLAPIDSEWDAYVIFAFYDKKVEALDSLICAAGRCEVNRESAILCNAEELLNKLVEKITKELSEKYGITYEEAIDLYNSFDREEYSIRMNALLDRLGIVVEE